jgi:ATP-binding cassette subfamily C protein LapB
MDGAKDIEATPREPAEVTGEPPEWRVPAATVEEPDPLLRCLEFLTEYYQIPTSAEVLRAGLPFTGEALTPELCLRSAERAGLVGRIVKREIEGLAASFLPAILLLRERTAAVLIERLDDGRMVVMTPEAGGGVRSISGGDLNAAYTGHAIVLRPDLSRRARSEATEIMRPKRWFWEAVARNWWIYGQVILAAVMINLFALTAPLFIMTVYDRVVPNNAIETLWVLAVGAVTVFGFDFVVRLLRGYYIDVAGRRTDVVLASRIFDQILGIRLTARPQSAGALANTVREFETLREFMTSATVATLVDLPFIFLFIAVVWFVGGPVAIIPLAAVAVVFIVGLIVQIPLRALVRESFRESEEKLGVLFETLGGLETIKATRAEGRMRDKWENSVALSARTSMRARLVSMMALNLTATVTQLSTVGIVVYGVILIRTGDLTVGALIACVLLAGRTLAPLFQVAQFLTRLNQARTSLATLNRVMAMPVERPRGRAYLHRPRLDGKIAFDHVSFGYPGAAVAAIQNVTFAIEAGERVGIIGRVGSGKSTLHKLLLGLYEPDEGSILVDGTESRQIDPIDLRRNIGCVPQDVVLFRGTIRENIAIGAPQASDAAVLRAAELATADDFVSRHPMGYDRPVGERGESLSGGQRQAIAAARAILHEPAIVLLDEPTSSMDSGAEARFKKNLDAALAGKTIILITHRASLLTLVDRLIVIEAGAVVADGPKETVLKAIAEGKVAILGGT